MFYVSCIVSQLTYSLGGSIFKGGIGSEMVQALQTLEDAILTFSRSKSSLSSIKWRSPFSQG